MGLSDAYASAAEYRQVIDMTDTGKDDEINKDLQAISRVIDGKMGRFFNKDADAVQRTYIAPAHTLRLWVDDMAEAPVAVKTDYIDGSYKTTFDPGDYDLVPFNADKEPEPRPFTLIMFRDRYLCKGQRVEVTCKFGWPEVPVAITRATIQLTAILRLESARATRRIPEMGDIIEASPDAMHIIRQLMDDYKRERYV